MACVIKQWTRDQHLFKEVVMFELEQLKNIPTFKMMANEWWII